MEKLLSLIPPQYKIAAGISVVVVLLGALGYVYYRIEQAGYNRCEAKEAVSAGVVAQKQEQATQQAAAAEIGAMQSTMEEDNERTTFMRNIENNIQAARKDGNGPLAPVLRDALGKLRQRQGSAAGH